MSWDRWGNLGSGPEPLGEALGTVLVTFTVQYKCRNQCCTMHTFTVSKENKHDCLSDKGLVMLLEA